MLGVFVMLTVTFRFAMAVLGQTPSIEMMELWIGLLQMVVGGLIAYIGTKAE